MAKLICIATCYMPTEGGILELFEDWFGNEKDVYEVPESKVSEYLASGNFKQA